MLKDLKDRQILPTFSIQRKEVAIGITRYAESSTED